jgi:prepilin-type N-terminal cleavage/methylation domain-containing protein
MKRMNPVSKRQASFSLMELLVVIAIIAVLVGLTATAVLPLIGSQSDRNTKTLMRKLKPELMKQWKNVIETAKATPIPPNVTNMAGGNQKTALSLWVKLNLKREFPMSYAEALNPSQNSGMITANDLPALPHFVTALTGKQSNNALSESSACLLIALQAGRKSGKFNAEEGLGASAMKDTDGDGVLEIIDGWGNPIAFYRWGTGNPDLLALASSSGSDDIETGLINTNWNPGNAAAVAEFQRLCHPIQSNGNPVSNTTLPVIVSAGKDGQLGLDYWLMTPQNGYEADNIYSFKVK